jgi:hypothetical protein
LKGKVKDPLKTEQVSSWGDKKKADVAGVASFAEARWGFSW